MKPQILSLGSLNADFQVRLDEEPGEREALEARDLLRLSGGKAANVAFLARRLGCESCLLARVGDDDLAAQALGALQAAAVDLSRLRRASACASGLSMNMVTPSGKKRMVAAGNANLGWSPADIEAVSAAVHEADPASVLVVDFEITPQAARAALQAARARGLVTVVDPAPPQRIGAEDLRGVHVVTPNEHEARAITGVDTPGRRGLAETARALAARGPRTVCIKLAEGGCLFAHEGRMWQVPSAGVEIVDTTGAGDAFSGALAVALLEGRSPQQAVILAVACSDLAVMAYGAQPAYPTRERLEAHAERVAPGLCVWQEQ